MESDRGKPLAGKSTLNRLELTPVEGPKPEYKKTSGGGSLQVELQDEDGDPLEGLSLEDCPPLVGDKIDGDGEMEGGDGRLPAFRQPGAPPDPNPGCPPVCLPVWPLGFYGIDLDL